MYPPTYFSDTGLDAALDVAAATKFATIVTIDGGSILPVHVPVSLRPRDAWRDADRPEFVGHIIISNPLFDILKKADVPATIIFQPAEGYVSPGVYDEKQRSGKVVPTWNYVAAHFEGSLHLEQAEGALQNILKTQIADYEGAVGGTWTIDDAPADYIDKMARRLPDFRSRLPVGKQSGNSARTSPTNGTTSPNGWMTIPCPHRRSATGCARSDVCALWLIFYSDSDRVVVFQ